MELYLNNVSTFRLAHILVHVARGDENSDRKPLSQWLEVSEHRVWAARVAGNSE